MKIILLFFIFFTLSILLISVVTGVLATKNIRPRRMKMRGVAAGDRLRRHNHKNKTETNKSTIKTQGDERENEISSLAYFDRKGSGVVSAPLVVT